MRMARRSSRRSSRGRAKRDLVWYTLPVELVASDTGAISLAMLTPAEWTAVPSISFERATLLRIVGWLSGNQLTAGTAADGTWLGLAIACEGVGAAAFSPVNVADCNDKDILHVNGWSLQATTSQAEWPLLQREIDIGVKRKLDSDTQISLHAAITTDTAAPTCTIHGILRFLIDRT